MSCDMNMSTSDVKSQRNIKERLDNMRQDGAKWSPRAKVGPR